MSHATNHPLAETIAGTLLFTLVGLAAMNAVVATRQYVLLANHANASVQQGSLNLINLINPHNPATKEPNAN